MKLFKSKEKKARGESPQTTSLSDQERRKIEEEAKLRAKLREKEEKRKQSKKAVGCLVVFLVIFIFIIVLIAISGDSRNSSPTTQPATRSQTLGVGEDGIVNNNSDKNDTSGIAILAVSEFYFDEFTQLSIARDEIGFRKMVSEGKLFTVKNGTAVKVIDLKFLGKTKVRILEGDYLGESGWIASEFVLPK